MENCSVLNTGIEFSFESQNNNKPAIDVRIQVNTALKVSSIISLPDSYISEAVKRADTDLNLKVLLDSHRLLLVIMQKITGQPEQMYDEDVDEDENLISNLSRAIQEQKVYY